MAVHCRLLRCFVRQHAEQENKFTMNRINCRCLPTGCGQADFHSYTLAL